VAPSVDIVIPVCNEAATLPELVARLGRACPDAQLIFVDNASTDGTVATLERLPGVRLVRHRENLGYGRSLVDGLAAATRELVVMIDADLEYPPEHVPALVDALGSADAVFGSRFLAADGKPGAMPWRRALGNRLVTGLFNVLFRQRLTDLYTGLRGLRREVLPPTELECDGFESVLELAVRLAQHGVRIREVPVAYVPRSTGRSKMRHLPEFLKFLYYLVRFRLTKPPAAAGAG
jgi:glycosyltransferase involved in cell wall biosynthesis